MGVICVPMHMLAAQRVKLIDIGQPAAQDHGIRIQEGDHPAQTAAEIIEKPGEGLDAFRVSVAVALGDGFHRKGTTAMRFVLPFDASAANQSFNTATVAAKADRSFGIDWKMAPFAGNSVQSVVDLTINADPATATGSHDHTDYDAPTAAGSF